MDQKTRNAIANQAIFLSKAMIKATLLTAIVAFPALAADGDVGLADTDTKVCGFLGNINNLLSMASVVVVTIAIVFAGYQIAFAHKRISDVAPILIGGLLIGAAGQIASMVISSDETCTAGEGSMLVNNLLQYVA